MENAIKLLIGFIGSALSIVIPVVIAKEAESVFPNPSFLLESFILIIDLAISLLILTLTLLIAESYKNRRV